MTTTKGSAARGVFRRGGSVLVVLSVLLGAAMMVQANDKTRPFTRLQSTTGGGAEGGQPQQHPQQEELLERQQQRRRRRLQEAASGSDQPLRPSEKVKFLQKMAKGNVDPMELFSRGIASKGFQVLLKNVEIQHRILEEMPLLAAFDGFRQITGRRLSDEQTAQGFTQGVQNVLAFAKEAFVKIKDPQQTAATIAKMAADPNPAIQDLFRRAQAGDSKAVEELQDVFNDLHFPGVNVRVLREVAENHTFDKLLGMPEIMRFIDRDETLSKLFRSDIKETFSFKAQDSGMFGPSKEQAASGTFTTGEAAAAGVKTATTTTTEP